MFKKKPRIIFTFDDDEKGFTLHSNIKGNVRIEHIKAVKSFIENVLMNKKGKNNGKDRRR